MTNPLDSPWKTPDQAAPLPRVPGAAFWCATARVPALRPESVGDAVVMKFRVSCTGCPFAGTYSSRARADHAMRVHSCNKHRARAEARARREARDAQVDRTPKPCPHKEATHRHGTRACYVLDRCRCPRCSAANSEAENRRYRLKAYGRYQGYVDADLARQHIRDLQAQGMGWKRIAQAAGVPHGVVSAIMYGKHRDHRNTGPQKRITQQNHAKIMAVEFRPGHGAPADADRSERARVKARALVALGWSMSKLGERIGIHPSNMGKVVHGDHLLQYGTIDKIEQLYEDLSMRLPPATSQRERISVARSKTYARQNGWQPPLDLEAQGADNPAYPDGDDFVDEQAIWRAMHGDRNVKLTKLEKVELIRRWETAGRPLNELQRQVGWNVWRCVPDARSSQQRAS